MLFIVPARFEGLFEEPGVPATDPSSPPTQEGLQRMLELGREYDTEYPSPPGG